MQIDLIAVPSLSMRPSLTASRRISLRKSPSIMNRYHEYPLAKDDTWPAVRRKTAKQRFLGTLKWFLAKREDLSGQLENLNALQAIGKNEIIVMTRQRNGIRFVRSFLGHYRALGADRFIFIDERSGDGTPEYLATQKDVITLTANTSFAEAKRGNLWFNAVFTHLPKGQRIVYVDNDEYLVFGDGTKKLSELFNSMKRHRMNRLATIMLDFYPQPPIKNAVFTGHDDTMPWNIATSFDASGYILCEGLRAMRVTGGARARLFGEDLFLTKYSVIFNTGRAIIDHSVHSPQPLWQNRGPVGAALLHFKYFSDFVDEHQAIVDRGVHHEGARAYRAVLDKLDGIDVAEEFDFTGECTVRYEGPAQLCELGLIEDICKDG